MANAVSEFLDFLAEDTSASASTIAAYHIDLQQLDSFLRGSLGEAWWEVAQASDLQAFVDELGRKGYADSSIARKRAAARSFFAFLVGRGIRRLDPSRGVRAKWPPRVRRTLSSEDVEAILGRSLDESASAESRRGRAMLETLYATGMRVTELLSLDVSDIHLEGANSYVRRRRRGKEELISLHKVAVGTLIDYLENARPRLVREAGQNALFVSHRGERLTRQGFWLIVKLYAKSAGLPAKVSPEILRQSFSAYRQESGRSG